MGTDLSITAAQRKVFQSLTQELIELNLFLRQLSQASQMCFLIMLWRFVLEHVGCHMQHGISIQSSVEQLRWQYRICVKYRIQKRYFPGIWYLRLGLLVSASDLHVASVDCHYTAAPLRAYGTTYPWDEECWGAQKSFSFDSDDLRISRNTPLKSRLFILSLAMSPWPDRSSVVRSWGSLGSKALSLQSPAPS